MQGGLVQIPRNSRAKHTCSRQNSRFPKTLTITYDHRSLVRSTTMYLTDPGAMAVMMSGVVVALSKLADDIHAKMQFELLIKPASSEDKAFLSYVAQTKDIKV